MIDEAKQYVDLGLPIIPVCAHDHKHTTSTHNERCKCPGKTPMIKGWQDHSHTSMADLESWIRSFKSFNIGLPLGDASGYCGIDVDGDEGVQLLQEMSKGDLPTTWEYTTGAGNRLIYRIPDGMKTKKFKQTGQGAHQECALLCTGQQTVLPPSIHHTGRVYEWVEAHSPWDLDCAVAPKWLLDKIKLEDNEFSRSSFSIDLTAPTTDFQFNADDEFEANTVFDDFVPESNIKKNVRAQGSKGRTGHKIVVTDELLTQVIPEGSRDNTMTAIIGHYCANRDLRRLGKDFILDICLNHNDQYCKPPLDEQSIRDKVDYFFETETLKDAEYASKKDKPKFEASKMAQAVLQYLMNGGVYLHFDQYSKIYYYCTDDQGPWHPTRNYALINKWIRDVLTSSHYGDIAWDKRSYVEETRTALEEHFAKPFTTVDDFDLGAHSPELMDYVVVNNGMVDWKKKKLIPWNPEYKTTIAFDVDYDPDATCPRFEKYLADWLPDNEVRMVIQEFLGYCLIPNTSYRKALYLYGQGKNGKSMLLEFIQDFFGDNKANLSYDGIFTRFGPAQLKDKLINVCDDTNITFTKETSIAKSLIAGGTISAEYKGQNLFTFQNVARFIYSSQETPRTSDLSEAWRDRWFFVKFPNKFRPSHKAKIEIQTALAEERSGIFNWMLEGLRRLMQNDDFTYSKELKETAKEYQAVNDNVMLFINNCCTTVRDPGIQKTGFSELYKVYEIWADNQSLRPVSKRVFSKRILLSGYERKQGYIDGKSGQTYYVRTADAIDINGKVNADSTEILVLDTNSEDYQEIAFEVSISQAAR